MRLVGKRQQEHHDQLLRADLIERERALSRLTHADARGLRFLHERGAIVRKEGAEVAHSQWNLYPAVDPVLAESILYVVSYESVGIATALCEVFGVGLEIPPWVSNELLRLKELAEQVAAEREETQKPLLAHCPRAPKTPKGF